MEDFAEIEPSGFKIEFTPHQNGGCVVSMEPSGLQGLPRYGCVRILSVVVNNNGVVLEFQSGWNSPYLRTHATYLVTDREGLLGRLCPVCKCYFRTNCFSKFLFCPYCAHRAENGAFTTENQRQFMYLCVKACHEAMMKKVKTTFDLGEAVKELQHNKPAWVCSEENQQHSFSCEKCRVVVNILGEYGNCSSCGSRNYTSVFDSKMQLLERQFLEKDTSVKEPQRRAEEWKSLLTRCVSEFESLANDMRKQLLRIPATKKRKEDFVGLSFQRILKAHECLKNWYGIEILGGFADDDSVFLNKMFNRRHLVIHTGSRVDDEYLKNTNDASVRLNQVIRIDSNEIRRLIPLTNRAGKNLIHGYDSIQ